MKVKVKKHKIRCEMLKNRPDNNCRHTINPFFEAEKSPAPLLSERALLKALTSGSPNLYSAVMKTLNCGSTLEKIRNNVSSFGVPKVCVVDDYPNQQIEEAKKRILEIKKELIKKTLEPFLTDDISHRDSHKKERIPEAVFIEVVDKIYNKVHNPPVKNGSMKYFPDLKISEYIKYFNL